MPTPGYRVRPSGITPNSNPRIRNAAAGARPLKVLPILNRPCHNRARNPTDSFCPEFRHERSRDFAGSLQTEIKDQKSEGNIDFDRTAGHVVRSHAKVKLSMSITIMSTKIDQTATNETTMRLAEDAGDKSTDK